MKKRLPSVLFGLLGLGAGVVICYTAFPPRSQPAVVKATPVAAATQAPPPVIVAAEAKANNPPVGHIDFTNSPFQPPSVPWEAMNPPALPLLARAASNDWRHFAIPVPQPPAFAVASQPGWRNFAIPMPQPPGFATAGQPEMMPQPQRDPYFAPPDVILPTYPPKINGHFAQLEDWAPKLIIPTLPPQDLGYASSAAR